MRRLRDSRRSPFTHSPVLFVRSCGDASSLGGETRPPAQPGAQGFYASDSPLSPPRARSPGACGSFVRPRRREPRPGEAAAGNRRTRGSF